MNPLEIERHKLIIEKAKELHTVCFSNDNETVANIIEQSQNVLDAYNKENLMAVDATKIELGKFIGGAKKLIYHNYIGDEVQELNDDINEIMSYGYDWICESHKIYYDEDDFDIDVPNLCNKCSKLYRTIQSRLKELCNRKQKMYSEFKNAVDSTVFSQSTVNKYILYLRQHRPVTFSDNSLIGALKNAIHLEILKEFQNQNQKLIIKHS